MSNEESNKLIDEFLIPPVSGTFIPKGWQVLIPNYMIWDNIMVVVEKIEAIHMNPHGYFGVYISSNSCTIEGTHFRSYEPNGIFSNQVYADTKLQAVYSAVVQFIEWYNLTSKLETK